MYTCAPSSSWKSLRFCLLMNTSCYLSFDNSFLDNWITCLIMCMCILVCVVRTDVHNSFLDNLFNYVYVCVGMCCESRCSQNPEEGIGYPRNEVTGSSKPTDMGSESQTQVHCKSSKCSLTTEPSLQPLFML